MENNGKYFFIPDWLLQENSQTIHAYIYILNEINRNGGELNTSYRIIAKELNLSLQNVRTIMKVITQVQRLLKIVGSWLKRSFVKWYC